MEVDSKDLEEVEDKSLEAHIEVVIGHDVEVPNVDNPPEEQIKVSHNMVTNEEIKVGKIKK